MLLKKSLLFAPLGLLSLTVLSGAFLMSSYSHADDSTVDNINITVPVSCSLEGTGMTSHNANMMNGTYQNNIGTTTMKAFCNDNNGFSIYAIGYSDDTYGETHLSSSVEPTYNIATGTATSGDVSNWAMKLSTPTSPAPTYPLTIDSDTNGSFTSYHIVPSTYTKVAHRDSGTDLGTSAEGATLISTYAAYINKTQPADTYTGQVIYTLVHPANETPLQPVACEAESICYQPNTGTALGEMGEQNAYNNASVTLWASNFKRDGYGFAGWNDKYDYSGNFYGPNQTITTPADVSTNGLSLYAVWIKSAGTIQNWDGCSSLASGATTALTDERDGNTYAVAKLADGKCWMIENLRLDDGPELSSANTHNPSLPLNNSWYFKDSQITLVTSNHLSLTTNPFQTAWCIRGTSDCVDQSMLATNNTTLYLDNNISNYFSPDKDVYSYGNYYNWYSATAGHGKYGSDYSSSYTASGDICPTGWHLPTGRDASGDFGLLDIALGGSGTNSGTGTNPTGETMSKRWRTFPNNYIYSGQTFNDGVGRRFMYAYYWASTSYDNTNANLLQFAYNSLAPGTWRDSKYEGAAIRCVSGD